MKLSEIFKEIVIYLSNNRYSVTVHRHNQIINSMTEDIGTLINAIELLKQSVEIKDNLNKKYKEKIDKLELELYQTKRINELLDLVRSN